MTNVERPSPKTPRQDAVPGQPMVRRALFVLTAVLAGAAAAAGEGAQPSGGAIPATTLARWLMAGQPVRVLDVRARAAYDEYHIPNAEHAASPRLAASRVPDERTVVYARTADEAAASWRRLRAGGARDAWYLRGGVREWLTTVQEPRLPIDPTPQEREAYDAAVPLSRYFGGQPRRDVPRDELPPAMDSDDADDEIRPLIRRGC